MKNVVKLSVAAILILMVQSCKKPSACITANDWVEVNQPLQLNSCSIDAKEYQWDFGDGATASGKSTSHVYNQIGSYSVQLSASNGTRSNEKSKSVMVVGPNYKFNGTYNVVENCGFGNSYYNVTIESIGNDQIKITNFLNFGWTIYGQVSGDNAILQEQIGLSQGGYYYDFDGGTATINGNTITMTYSVDDLNYANLEGWIDCGATLTK